MLPFLLSCLIRRVLRTPFQLSLQLDASGWFPPPRADDASGKVQHLSVAGNSGARIFYIRYLEYRNFPNTTFRYKLEDYAVLFSALVDTYLIQYSANLCHLNMSKNAKNEKMFNDQVKLTSMTGSHQGSIFYNLKLAQKYWIRAIKVQTGVGDIFQYIHYFSRV